MEIRWLSIFADVPADQAATALDYWAAVTGTTVGAAEGEAQEFVPLVPPDGDPHLWVQRIGDGEPRWHLDLHVDDVEAAAAAAEGLGARRVASDDDLRVLTTPAGQPFCFVTEQPGRVRRRPEPPRFDSGRSLPDQLSLDLPTPAFDRDSRFWHELTGWRLRGEDEEGFDRIGVPERLPAQLLLQRLKGEDDRAHAHLDLSSDDRDAEAARHVGLGAEVVRRTEGWTTLRDPVGLVYCVTRRRTGVRFT